jgi:arylsulfatase B
MIMNNSCELYNRSRFLTYSVVGLSTVLLPSILSSGRNEDIRTKNNKPNILIIIADDLGWNDVGYHGSEIRTPVIDKMSRSGIEFNRFYVCSVCSPTRASLLTGRYPSRYGILEPLGKEPGLPAGTTTIAGILRKNGYDTGISGKWHLGSIPQARPLNYGFNSSYGYLLGQIDPFTHLYKNGSKNWHRNDSLIDEAGHSTDLITEEAIRFINKPRTKDSPFFLYVAYSVPHYPLEEEKKWTDIYIKSIANESRRKNAAAVTHMDHEVGRILGTLKKNGLEKNTIVMFLSDNGAQKDWVPASINYNNKISIEYDGKFKIHDVLGDNRPLRDWKTTLYDGALRVPAVLIWPGKIKHRKVDETLNVTDIFPTLAYLANVEITSDLNIEGFNFWPAVEGMTMPDNRIMYWRLNNGTALKKGDWKLYHKGRTLKEGSDELYNIRLDPYENQEISANNQAKVLELKKAILDNMSRALVSTKN